MTLNPLPSSNPLTLEAVKVQLDHWRETRVKGDRMPKYLWNALAGLTKQYSCSQIASELKINPYRLRDKMAKQSKQASLSATEFVEVSLTPFANPLSAEQKTFYPHSHMQGTLEVTRPDGAALKASGLNHDHLCSLVKNFLGQ